MDPIFNKSFVDRLLHRLTLEDFKDKGEYNLKFNK